VRPYDPRLATYAKATRGYLVACVALGLVTAGLVLAQATLLATTIARAFGGAGLDDLYGELVALGVVVVLRALAAWAADLAAQRTSAAVKTQLRGRLLGHLVRLGPDRGTADGETATLLTRGLDALDPYFARYLPQLVLAAVVPVVVLARLLPADWIAGVTVAVTLPLIPVFMALVGATTGELNRRRLGMLTQLGKHFLDVLAGLPTLTVFGRAKAQAASIAEVTGAFRRTTMRTLRLAFLSSLVLELLATLSVALVAVGIGLRLVRGELDLRTALLVLILAPEAYLPLRRLAAQYHASTEGLAVANRVFAVLERPEPVRGTRTDVPDPKLVPVRIEGLTVHHEGRPEAAPDGLSLTVRPGAVTAIAGPSGCGKSTLLAVLLGLTRPDAGRVLVGDTDLADLDPDAWRRRIGWLPQRPHLFTSTVADNIRLGRPDATADEIRTAARRAGAGFVDGLPDGYYTVIGDGGRELSAGQRQRVALARVLLRDAPLVLLDEPTANLDAETEAVLTDAIRALAGTHTVIAVAHRPALLALADEVVTLPPAAGIAAHGPTPDAVAIPTATDDGGDLVEGARR
jgi:thiol reductant ABC exporter CydD subunit